jgi:hypothetical protein
MRQYIVKRHDGPAFFYMEPVDNAGPVFSIAFSDAEKYAKLDIFRQCSKRARENYNIGVKLWVNVDQLILKEAGQL